MRRLFAVAGLALSVMCFALPATAQKRSDRESSGEQCHVAPGVAKARAQGAVIDSEPHALRQTLFGGTTACREEVVSIFRGDPMVFTATYEYGGLEGVSYVLSKQRAEHGDDVRLYLGQDAVPNFANAGNVVLGWEDARCFLPKDRSRSLYCEVGWGGGRHLKTISEIIPGKSSEVSLANASISELGVGRAGAVTVAGRTVDIPFVATGDWMMPYEGKLTGQLAAMVTNAALQAGNARVIFLDDNQSEIEVELDLGEMRLATAMVRRIGPAMLAGRK